MSNTQKNVIVTGGAGFIGSHLVELLLAEGHKVTIIDNFSTGRPENLEHLKENKNLELIFADITDFNKIEPLFTNKDWIFHLAALADIVPSIEMPDEYHKANVNGTFNVLQASVKHNIKRFVYSASSSCYGIPDIYPTPEDTKPSPQYPYALTKFVGEQYIMHWAKVYKLPAVALRLFNVYGTRSRTSGTYGAMFGVFLAQKLANKPYTIVGDGNQTRDFTYVTDVARAFYSAAKSSVCGEIFNVGSGNTYSINKIVELMGGDKVHITKRPGEPDCTFADISKIQNILGWKPQITIEQGVKNLIDNIDYWKKAPVWDENSIAEATKSWFKYLS